jgi:hypothetical protein
MLTIAVSQKDFPVVDVTGFVARVRNAIVKEGDNYVSLQNSQPFKEYKDVKIILMSRFFSWRLSLTDELKEAIKLFMKKYHAQQNLSVDCYAFANMVKGVEEHKVTSMLLYWRTRRLWFRPKPGSVIFLIKGKNQFRHAAVYIGRGLYISAWGAGGDLEIASLKSMKIDFVATRVELAIPR